MMTPTAISAGASLTGLSFTLIETELNKKTRATQGCSGLKEKEKLI
jgi:hypothetical protein